MGNTKKTPEELKKEAEAKKLADANEKVEAEKKAAAERLKNDEAEKLAEAEKEAEVKRKADAEKAKDSVVLTNVLGKKVSTDDYFYKGIIPSGFKGTCGKPVDRDDLVELFHKVFKPEDNILFYKQLDKEVYIVIIPIKFSTSVGEHNDSLEGEFQKHAISFLNEGMVNLDTMRKRLEQIKKHVNYSDR